MTTETTLEMSGMRCGSCAQQLSLALERRAGVIKARVDPAGAAEIRFDEARLDEEQLGEVIGEAGFDLA
jgi:copper chaperone CopZ